MAQNIVAELTLVYFKGATIYVCPVCVL